MKITNLFRLSLFVLSLVFSVNVAFAQLSDPIVSYVGDGCGIVKFRVDNYDSSLAYDVKVNGISVSLAGDGTYTESSPTRDVDYTISVSCEDFAAGLSSSEVTSTAKLPKAVETPTITAADGCDVPVKFTITNYNSSSTYTWTVNGGQYSAIGSTFEYPNPQDGVEYTATVKVDDGCTSATSAPVSQTYKVTPATPVVSANEMLCDGNLIFTIDNYDSDATYTWTLNTGTGSASGKEYVVSNPQDRTDYSVSVIAEKNGCTSAAGTATRGYIKTPELPVISVTHNCSTPIFYTLDNNSSYPSTYTQSWVLNGSPVNPTSGKLEYASIEHGEDYMLTVTIDNTYNGKTCSNSASATQRAKLNPIKITAASYSECQETGVGKWIDLLTNVDPACTLNWYDTEISTTTVSAPNDFDKNIPGTPTYWVTQVNSDGCESDRTKVEVNVDKIPLADAGADIAICEGNSAILAKDLPKEIGVTYYWEPRNELKNNDDYSVETKALGVDTEFTLTVSNSKNPSCSTTDKVWVKVLKKPVITLDKYTDTVCKGDGVSVKNSTFNSATEYLSWTSSPKTDVVPYPTLSSITTNALDEDVTLTLTSYLKDLPECKSTADVPIVVMAPPALDAGPDKEICYGGTTRIGTTQIPGVSYLWDNATKLDDPNLAMPTISSVTGYTKFKVQAWLNSLPNCKSEDYVEVSMVPLPTIYTVSGGGEYCDGNSPTNVNVNLSSSDDDTEYLLLRNGNPVDPNDWKVGVNGILTWENNVAGFYTVKARKKDHPECQINMTGSATVKSVKSPDADIFIKDGRVACPGDEVTIRIELTNGEAPYTIKLLENEVEQIFPTNDNYYEFTRKLLKSTKFEISSIEDKVCEKIYASTDYPTLDLDIPNIDEFVIHSDNGDKAYCFGEKYKLCVDYAGGGWKWEDGATTQCVTGTASVDKEFNMTVETPEGCKVPVKYPLQVVEKLSLEIHGLEKYKEEVDPITGDVSRMYYQCYNDGDVALYGTPGNGEFSVEPAGVLDGDILKPEQALQTGAYTITYKYIDTPSGCEQETSTVVYLSALNKEIGWTQAPAFNPPWGTDEISICQPHVDNPKQNIKLQGYPQLAAGKWELLKTTANDGTPAADGAVISPITGVPTAETALSGVVAGHIYEIRYSVVDQYNCESYADRTIRVKAQEQSYIDAKGFGADPSLDLCKNQTSATIYSNYPVGNFVLSGEDRAMEVSQLTDKGKIEINPSLGSLGSHKLIHSYQDNQGCPFSEEVFFTINEPIRINSFGIPSEYCEKDAPVDIKITSEAMTNGHVKIFNSKGVTVLDETLIGTPPQFKPEWGAETYTIVYYYDDGICKSEHFETVVVHPLPKIDFNLKTDYCKGEVIEIVPNYTGGDFTTDAPDGTIKSNYFDTNVSGIGTFKIRYEVKNEFGCSSLDSTSIIVHGKDPLFVNVSEYFCEPRGQWPIFGSTKDKPNDNVYFTSDASFTGVIDNGDGTGFVDLSNALTNTSYPLTYHYIQEYTSVDGNLQTCETTATKYFKILNEGSDFSGYVDNETICGDVESIKIEANIKENTEFAFSHESDAECAGAFVDNKDGTATLYPNKLPERQAYSVTMTHVYDDGSFTCTTQKTKIFSISKIEEIKDISLFCDPTANKAAVKLENTEAGIRYDLYVNDNDNAVEYLTANNTGDVLTFSPITESPATVRVIAVEPKAQNCTRQMSKEFNVVELYASVIDNDITCNKEKDGKFIAEVSGGIPSSSSPLYSHLLTNTDTGEEIVSDSLATGLPAGKYQYKVEDNIKCTRTVDFEITEPKELQATITQEDVDCVGNSTADITVSVDVTTGTWPYTYKWTRTTTSGTIEVGNSATIEDQPAGAYEVLVTDKNGCFKTFPAYIDAPEKALTVELVKKVDVLISGQATGEIEIKVDGGTQDASGEYTYTWIGKSIDDSNRNQKNLTGLKADTYKVKVTDSKGCEAELVVEITQPTPFNVKYTVNDVSCNGKEDGAIYLEVTGATPPYTYKWTYPDGSIESKDDLEGLKPSELPYELIIEDSKGDVYEKSFYISEPSLLSVSTRLSSKIELNCKGDNDGSINLKIDGGTPDYTVIWPSIIQPDQIIDDTHVEKLIAGKYTIKVKDKNNCEQPHEVIITEPDNVFELDTEEVIQNKCNNGTEGSITINLKGGTPNYSYTWSGSSVNPSSQNQVNLKPGDYHVIAEDAKGCVWEKTYTLINPDVLSVTLKPTHITCKDSKNGKVEAEVIGGQPHYNYSWKDEHSNPITGEHFITGLEKGIYSVEVTDNLGCIVSSFIEIEEPEALVATIKQNPVSCNGADNGKLEVIAEGGTKGTTGYSYKWFKIPETTNPYKTDTHIIDALVGETTYKVEVTDANDCKWESGLITINEPKPLKVTYIVEHVKIHGEATGKIFLTIEGGTEGLSGYTIQWLNGPSIIKDPADPNYNEYNKDIENLSSGLYYASVSDENGCTEYVTIEVTQPEVLSVDAKEEHVSCNGKNDGRILINKTEGGDGNYTYVWKGLNTGYYNDTSVNGNISGLVADIYELTITDGAGATLTKSYEVTQPDAITITTVPERSVLFVECYGEETGKITVEIKGGTSPYTYEWSGPSTVIQNEDNIKDRKIGFYSIDLKDANGCKQSYREEIKGPEFPLNVTGVVTDNECYGQANASIDVTAEGGTSPYEFQWTGGPGLVIDSEDQNTLYNGEEYTVNVTDRYGCSKKHVFVLEPRNEILIETFVTDVKCYGEKTGEIKAVISGGSGDLTPKWESNDGSYECIGCLEETNLPAGKYIFTVKDNKTGCVITKEVEISQPDELKATITGTELLCSGVDEGELIVTVTGGTENYKYTWVETHDRATVIGQTSRLSNLGAGNYEVFIEDIPNGCTTTTSKEIRSSAPMTIEVKEVHNVEAYGGNDGYIKIEVYGGKVPLSFNWSAPGVNLPYPNNQNQQDLTANDYTVTVTDGEGCSISKEIEVTQPDDIEVIPDLIDIKCPGDEGSIKLDIRGGQQPYKVDWNGDNGYSRSGVGLEFYAATGLKPGTYVVTITDKEGTGISMKKQYSIREKRDITWLVYDEHSKKELNCVGDSDGKISIGIDGGTSPYSVEWYGPNNFTSNLSNIGELVAGDYYAKITDAYGCEVETSIISITEPTDALKLESRLTHNVCASDKVGAIDITVSGGTSPYEFKWTGGSGIVTNSEDQKDLPKGTYRLSVTDANKCVINEEFNITANKEGNATIAGPSSICSGEEFEVQITLMNGDAPWYVKYTDGTVIYEVEQTEESKKYKHSLSRDGQFQLIEAMDANDCLANLSGRFVVDVNEVPSITIASAETDCCLDETALVDIIFAGKGPWTINYTDGTDTFVSDPFTAERGKLEILQKQVGTKTYTIESVSNDKCTIPVNYSVDITTYSIPNLEVNVSSRVCEPNPIKVYLHATGEAPWNVVYYFNNVKQIYNMQEEEETFPISSNKTENKLIFESISSGQSCVTKLDLESTAEVALLPRDARTIVGKNMVCRNSTAKFQTTKIDYAESYEWELPAGFKIESGRGSSEIEVSIADDAVGGEIKVWGVNSCGVGNPAIMAVEVDKPISEGGKITIPNYVCDDNTIFSLEVSDVENATNYEWIMPAGYNILSGQGTKSIKVQIDKYAQTNTVSVIPSNVCTEAKPISATIFIRPLPFSEAGTDFITKCSPEAQLAASNGHNMVSTQWKLLRGNAKFEDPTLKNTKVYELMYGENLLSWNVNDGYCVGYDTVKVTNWNPGITEPEFSETTICEDYMTLRAGMPEFGVGHWTLTQGDGEIENPNSNETIISGLSNKQTNIIRWEVYSPESPNCKNSVEVKVVSHSLHSLVNAGEDGISTTGSFRLAADNINDGEVTGTWSVVGGEGTIEDPNNPNTVVTGLATGINTLRWTLRGYDCEAYDEVRIRMVDEPIASFNIENAEGCEPLTVLFTNTTIGKAEYKWEFGDGSTSNLRNPEHIYEKAGVYNVKMTATGDKRTDVMTGVVTVLPSPVAAFSVAERQLYVPNAEAHFYNESEDVVQYLWDFGDGGSSNSENPVYTYLEDGLYDVKYIVTDKNLCSDTLVVEDYIRVGKDSYLVFPTAFTPNVEHSNGGAYSEGERRLDVFYPIGRNVDTYKLEIFSSWGNKVFESNDQYIGWDGYYLGQCAAQGTYLYKAEGRFKDGNAFQYSGNLMLIR